MVTKNAGFEADRYKADKTYDLGGAAQVVTSTGDLVGYFDLKKPQQNAVLNFKTTTIIADSAVAELQNSDDDTLISLAIPSGTAVDTSVVSTTTALSAVDLAVGVYKVNITTASNSTGAGYFELICREKYDSSVAE